MLVCDCGVRLGAAVLVDCVCGVTTFTPGAEMVCLSATGVVRCALVGTC